MGYNGFRLLNCSFIQNIRALEAKLKSCYSRRMKIVSLIYLVLFSLPAQAWIVGSKSSTDHENSVCRIMYRDMKGKLLFTCSGTLVAPTKIITARHCIEDHPDSVSVECGYLSSNENPKIESTLGGAQVMTDGVQFKEKRTDVVPKKDKTSSEIDIGVIELKTAITTVPSAQFSLSGLNDFFENVGSRPDSSTPPIMRAGVECRMFGFGMSGEGTSGRLHSAPLADTLLVNQTEIKAAEYVFMAQLPKKALRSINSCTETFNENLLPKDFIPLAKKLSENSVFEGILAPGDSGGPLMCRKVGASTWTIIAVASTVEIAKHEGSAIGSVSTWQVLSKIE